MARHTPKRWNFVPGDEVAENRLCVEMGLPPIIARLLVQRGVDTPEAADLFLHPSLDRMHDPFLLPDAEAACERLKQALARKEKILVHGDYDGDGLTSAALWTRVLRSLGGDVSVFVPHRRRDGYDMRKPIIEQASADGVKLIVTTDCGIQRVDEVEHAREQGIDVIITDHHMPRAGGALPRAVAVVNPHRSDSRYPFSELAGVGVAFRLCEGLTRHLGHNVNGFRRGFLDLAAIGTVTDVMPLFDENRIIVKHGLEALQSTKKPGLRALIDVSGYTDKPLDTRSIGFGLGPRLNSASRIDETQIALDLLLTTDAAEARALADKLNELNVQRRESQNLIFEEALQQVALLDVNETRCFVLSADNWSGSVIGIVASKIVDRFHRPCVMIGIDPKTGRGRGSARSFGGFNILNAIQDCAELLGEYGGHANAAGLAIDGDAVVDFAAQMDRIAHMRLSEEDCIPSVDVAMELHPSEVNAQLLDAIGTLAPFGSGNPEPQFVSRSVPIREVRRMGKEEQHLKLSVDAGGLSAYERIDAPWFFRGELAESIEAGMSLDLCYRPQFNEWNGRRKIQFMLEDVQNAEW